MDEMTHLYAVVEDGGETEGVFSTLDKAKAAVEANIRSYESASGRPEPELTWSAGHRDGVYVCDPGNMNIYVIELDPKEL